MTEMPEILKMLSLGLTAGILSGLFGIGGGLVIVPALVLIFGFDTKMAVGTSLFVILLPTGLLGVLEYWRNNNLRVAPGLWIALGVFAGAYAGALLAGRLDAASMKRFYAIFLVVVALYFLFGPNVSKRALPPGMSADPTAARDGAQPDPTAQPAVH
jgi:uncharacterized membrane protein YfcA